MEETRTIELDPALIDEAWKMIEVCKKEHQKEHFIGRDYRTKIALYGVYDIISKTLFFYSIDRDKQTFTMYEEKNKGLRYEAVKPYEISQKFWRKFLETKHVKGWVEGLRYIHALSDEDLDLLRVSTSLS
jgi:hypothetical protein